MNVMKAQVNAIMAQSNSIKTEMSPLDFLESFCYLIGNPDSMLRADLMTPVFRTFGENDETFSNKEAAAILERLTGPDNMKYGNCQNGPYIFFTRSYSALVIASLLWRQQNQPFLNPSELQTIEERLSPGLMIMHTA